MNLYDRLKKEHKYKLELEAIRYPDIVDQIIDSLKDNDNYFGLTFLEADRLKRYAGVDLNDIIEAFNYEDYVCNNSN